MVGVEPYLGHAIQGLKNMKESYKPGIFDKGVADDIVNVEDEEAYRDRPAPGPAGRACSWA